jgi:Acyltransferase family
MAEGPRADGSAPGGRGSAVESWAAKRALYLDNLKVIPIAAIIAGHAISGYSELEFWPYSEMKEVELSAVTQLVLLIIAGPFSLLLIPLLFLVAGLLTPSSLERKGPGSFARARLVRLGVPFALYVVLLQPLLMYPVHPPGETPRSYWSEFLGAGEQTLGTGPLWFVGVLLIFSLVYAGLVGVRGSQRGQRWHGEVRVEHLLVLAAAVALATFLVRVQVPLGGSNRYVTLNVWEWPACLALFGLGIVASGNGWLTAVPERLGRQGRALTLAALVGFVSVAGVAGALGVPDEETWGGWHWAALGWATFESALAVFGPVWLLQVSQRHLNRRLCCAGPKVSRSAYGAFVLQGLFLIGLAFALRSVPLPAEVKGLLVAAGSVVGSFALGWLLISRVPGMARVV